MSESKYTKSVRTPFEKRVSALTKFFGSSLPGNYKTLLFNYYFNRFTGKAISKKQKDIYYLYSYLTDTNAKLVEEYEDEYKVELPEPQKKLRIHLRKYPSSDQWVYSQVFIYKQYKAVTDMILQSYSPNMEITIIDAGANIGMSSLFFKSIFPNARILTIEPEPSNFQQLKKNTEINNFSGIFHLQSALWYREANLAIVESEDKKEWAFSVQETQEAHGVKGYDISYYLNHLGTNKATLIKIDIEGAERYLFENRERCSLLLSQCEYLAIEIHDQGNLREEIYNYLKEYGFEYIDFDELTIAKKKQI